MKPIVLKRHVKLKNLKYEIPGEETRRLVVEPLVWSAISIFLCVVLIIVGSGILKSITS